jgi:hypothetical protein
MQVPMPSNTAESVDAVLDFFRSILELGGVQRFEMEYQRPYAVVDQMVRADQVPDGAVVVDGPPADERVGKELDQRASDLPAPDLDLHTLFRSGDLTTKEVTVDDESDPVLTFDAVQGMLNQDEMHVTHILAGHADLFMAYIAPFREELTDEVVLAVLEEDGYIPQDTFIVFAGPVDPLEETAKKTDLMVAYKCNFVLDLAKTEEEDDDVREAREADDREGPGSADGGSGDDEEGDDPAGAGPPLFVQTPGG